VKTNGVCGINVYLFGLLLKLAKIQSGGFL